MSEDIETSIANLPVRGAFIGASFECFAVKFGPYPPEKVGEFLTRLMAEHEGPHPFYFALECDAIDDPVPHLLDMARDDEGAASVDERSQSQDPAEGLGPQDASAVTPQAADAQGQVS